MSFYTFSSKERPLLFVAIIASMLAILAVMVWFTQFYFIKTGDLITEDEVVRIQLAAKSLCLYDTLAGQNHAAYKLALYRQTKPQVVTIGSSRVLQLRSKMFTANFINLGRTMNYLAEGPGVLSRITQYGKPDLALIGIDFWWFNPNIKARSGQAHHLVEVKSDSPAMLKSLIGNTFKRPRLLSAAPGFFQAVSCHIGAAAKLFLNGFGPDGSRYYGSTFTRTENVDEAYGFANTLERIRQGKKGFQHASAPDIQKIDQFISFVEALKVQGIEPIVFAPPLAPTVIAAMEKSGHYDYMAKTIDILRKRGLKIFDFHNPNQIALSDCDFIDGFHVGDTGTARMLGHMARSQPNLHKVVNHNELDRLAMFKNRAGVYFTEAFGIKETDFLNLGCVKSS